MAKGGTPDILHQNAALLRPRLLTTSKKVDVLHGQRCTLFLKLFNRIAVLFALLQWTEFLLYYLYLIFIKQHITQD